jgi:hypothetical protein
VAFYTIIGGDFDSFGSCFVCRGRERERAMVVDRVDRRYEIFRIPTRYI